MLLKHQMYRTLTLIALGLLAIDSCKADAIAQALPKIDDSISQSVDLYSALIFDTNPRLSEDPVSVWISRFIPRYKIQHNSDHDEQYLDMAFTVQRSTDSEVSVDRNDPKITLGFNHLFSKGAISSSVGFSKRSTRISEFDDTGLVFADGSRYTRFFNINGIYQFSSIATLNTGYSLSDNSFSGSNQLRAYTSSSLNSSYNYQFNDKLSGIIAVSVTEISRSTGKTYLLNPTVGLSWMPLQSVVLDISVGKSRVYLKDLPANDGLTYSANSTYTAERDTFNASFIRSVRPNGLGFQESDKALLKWSRKINDENDFYLSYALNKNNTINQVETASSSIGYNKKLNNEWGFNLYAKHRQRTATNADTTSNIVGFVIKYGFSDFQDDY